MPKLIITDRSGKKSEIEYDSNFTLMETLRDNGYDIEASCGGCCSCATCHVHVPDNWLNITGPASDDTAELSLLEYEPNFDDKQSRLSCQIILTKKHHGLIVYVP